MKKVYLANLWLFLGWDKICDDGKKWFGAGHNAVYNFGTTDYIVYHGYDANDRGRTKLIIEALNWNNGWPVANNQP